MLDLQLLRNFATVARLLNFRAAAAELYIAQPALSQQIQKLERDLGCALLTRTTRSVSLTDMGRALLQETEPILAAAAAAERRVREMANGTRGRLHLLNTRSAPEIGTRQVVGEYRARFPDVTLDINTAWTSFNVAQLLAEQADVAFVRLPLDQPGIETVETAHDELVVVIGATHELSGRASLTFAEVREMSFVLWPRIQGPGHYDAIISQIWGTGTPTIVREEPEAEQLLASVRDGGVATLMDRRRAEKLQQDGVVVARIEPPVRTLIGAAWRSGDNRPMVAHFVQICEKYARQSAVDAAAE